MNNFISTVHSKRIQVFICLFLAITWGNVNAQVNPNGGFEIDGDLESNSPTSNVGDWVEGNIGSGGFVFEDDGEPVDTLSTKLVRDEYNVTSDDVFKSGYTIDDSPNDWVWV